MTEKLHVDLSGAPQTMLATFYAKALDADLPEPILGDRFAKEIVDRID
jgi:O-methyltransferase involved in polyketide biosynthesis